MEPFFKYATPVIYWILMVVWTYILIFYAKKVKIISSTDKLLRLLLLILALDAFRTLLESMYFGAWYTSLSGLIPIDVFNFLARPQIVFIPKIINLTVAALIMTILIRKWLSSEIKQKKAINDLIIKQTSDLAEANKILLSAKEKSEENKERFKVFTNQATDGITVADLEGNYIFINPAFCKMSGYTEEELLKMTVYDMRADSQTHDSFFESKTRQGEPIEVKLKRKDQTEYYTEIIGKIIKLNNQEFVLGTIRDITERKKAEHDLKESEERFTLAMKASNDGLFDWNLVTNEIYYSPGWKKMLGYADHELPNDFSIWENLTEPEDVKKSWELQQKLITKQEDRFVMEFKMKHKEGHWVDILSRAEAIFDDSGKAIRILGTHTDITERKKAQEKLSKNEERLRTIFEAMNEGFSVQEVICDKDGKPCDLRFLEANPAFETQTGLKNEETFGHTLLELFPDSEPYWIERYGNVGLTGIPIKFEAMFGPLDIYYSVNAFQIEYGKFGVMFTDINERKKAELLLEKKNEQIKIQNEKLKTTNAELIQAKEQAEESDRLKSAFLANMSHEIRTPMNGILGFASLLKDPDISGEKQQEYIQIIEKSGARMLNIINDIVDISKIESGLMNIDLRKSNVNEQIEDIYTFFKPEVEAKGIRFSFHNPLPSKEAIIKTDSEKLYAILTNLVKNAIKFTKEGSISLGYNVIHTNPGQDLRFFVKDTGIGIPAHRQEAIFERFVQADISDKLAYQGAGLGLSISKAYVEMLGGRIWVESDEDKGTDFYFTLPYNPPQIENSVAAGNAARPAEPIEVSGLKVLIAEDDDTSEILISIIVKKFSKEIIKTSTGREAVEICRKNPDIDLILMDIQMPDLNGHDAVRQIRGFNKDVIIIAQTAYGLSGDRDKAIEAGCNDYLSKPINSELLTVLIQKHIGKLRPSN